MGEEHCLSFRKKKNEKRILSAQSPDGPSCWYRIYLGGRDPNRSTVYIFLFVNAIRILHRLTSPYMRIRNRVTIHAGLTSAARRIYNTFFSWNFRRPLKKRLHTRYDRSVLQLKVRPSTTKKAESSVQYKQAVCFVLIYTGFNTLYYSLRL